MTFYNLILPGFKQDDPSKPDQNMLNRYFSVLTGEGVVQNGRLSILRRPGEIKRS